MARAKQLDKNEARRRKELAKKLQRPGKINTTAETIRYTRMIENGICEIVPGVYSKTIKFSDINYSLAKEERKIALWTKYCELLNSLPSSISAQINTINRRTDRQVFVDSVMIPAASDGNQEYRDEINELVASNMCEGDNSIVITKYLTFTVYTEEYDDAVKELARVEAEIENNFKSLGCETQVLDGIERLELLNYIMKPNETFTFRYEQLLGESLTTKDFIAPSSFDFSEKSFFEVEDQIGQVMLLEITTTELPDDLLSQLTTLNGSLVTSMHIQSEEQDIAIERVKVKIGMMEGAKSDVERKAAIKNLPAHIPYELQRSLDEAYKLQDLLLNKKQRMFKVTILLYTYDNDVESFTNNVHSLMTTARVAGCKLQKLDFAQEEAFNSCLPLGMNYIDRIRTLTTASTAIFIPFTTQDLVHKGGISYGINALSHNIIMLDRTQLVNGSGFILGIPGGGKSMMAKWNIGCLRFIRPDDDIIAIDPEREYKNLADATGGEVINISEGSKTFINPFDITDDYDKDNPLAFKTDFITSMCEVIMHTHEGMSPQQKSVISRVCDLTYESYFNAKKHGDDAPMPTMKDFYDILREQEEPEARSIALALERFVNGSLNVFANRTNVETDNRFIVFDIKDLGKQLKTLGMLVVLDQIWNRITANRAKGRRTWVFIDEIHLLFANEYAALYCRDLWKRARKWGAIPTGITQNVEDLITSDIARTMLSNSEVIALLAQSHTDRVELAELLDISPEQMEYVINPKPGEGLLRAGETIIPFKNKIPNHLKIYQLMTTKPEDVAAQQDDKSG
ncbi:MAG: ATP-binding protein [Oscillospiraceae bacterium]|nr:ATP-binding protein [Oscillospiraceae bacterium]